MLKYTEYPPGPALAEHIVCFWTMTSSPSPQEEPKTHRVLPDCCSDIIFDFSSSRLPAFFVGTMTRALSVPMGGAVDLFGIRFKAGAARAFLQTPLAESTDLSVDLENFWGATDLRERLAEVRETSKRVAIVEHHLLSKFAWAMALDPYVQFCVQTIETSHGLTPTAQLEKGTGLGLRQIERKFLREIGIGPKAYARIVRFLSVIREAKAVAQPDWAGLAVQHGYSDQSHLAREFKEFSGVTPAAFIAEQ